MRPGRQTSRPIRASSDILKASSNDSGEVGKQVRENDMHQTMLIQC
jgi:hypothetical protein